MASNAGGKTTIIFFILVVVVLISGVSISLFLLNKETVARKSAEASLEESQLRNVKLGASFKEAGKQIDVLKGKNKDADDKINSLMEELDLQAALRDEIKGENKKLKDALETEAKARIEVRQKLTADLESVQAKLREAEARAAGQDEVLGVHKKKVEELQKKNDELEEKIKGLQTAQRTARNEILPAPGQPGDEKVDLDRIVVTPAGNKDGHVLNVDSETEFLIFDLGTKSGIKPGEVMSVYRGKSYLGDVKVSRVQDEMSAADFIPPFSSKKVRKNDLVVPKK